MRLMRPLADGRALLRDRGRRRVHRPGAGGARPPGAIRLFGTVSDGEGVPVNDTMIEIWQANAAGATRTRRTRARRSARGRLRRVRPRADRRRRALRGCDRQAGPGAGRGGTMQAPHIEMSVFARGLLKRLVTRVYFPDEAAANEADPVLRSIETPRRGRPWWPFRTTAGYGSTSTCKATARPPSLPFDALFVPADVREATGERAWVQAMLDFEAALAQAQGMPSLPPRSPRRHFPPRPIRRRGIRSRSWSRRYPPARTVARRARTSWIPPRCWSRSARR